MKQATKSKNNSVRHKSLGVMALAILMWALALQGGALAQRASSFRSGAIGVGIVAVVNDSVITTLDLEQRVRLAMMSSGMPDNAEVRSHLLPQVFRTLMEEQLQIQEAKKMEISVSKEEIDQTLSRIAQDNHIEGDMLDFITARGASADAMTAQIRSGLLWSKVVQRELRPRVEVADDEIDAAIERIRANSGKEEFLVSEILLTVENPDEEGPALKLAENLIAEIRRGANFSAVARQFSRGLGATQGGDIGWIQQGQLAPEVNRALSALAAGKVSDPIVSSSGIHIFGMRDRRTVSLGNPEKSSMGLVQAFRSYVGVDRSAVLREASRLRTSVNICASSGDAVQSFPGWKIQKLGDVNMAKAPSWLTSKVSSVAVGGSSEPLSTDKGAAVIFVCSRDDSGIDREAIMRSIGTEKLELQARRLLRDLRRSAHIDIRIGKE